MRRLSITSVLWKRAAKGVFIGAAIVGALAFAVPGLEAQTTSTLLTWFQALLQRIQAHHELLVTHNGAQTSQHEGHDAAQTSQHDTLGNSLAGHATTQMTEHNALSGKLDVIQTAVENVSTGGDHSGLVPAWDKRLSANDGPDSCHSSRFTCVMNGEGVRDNETGLVWERQSGAGSTFWEAGLLRCLNSVIGGRQGWRVPSIQELGSLVDASAPTTGAALPVGHPFDWGVSTDFARWSATANSNDATQAWAQRFFTGNSNGGTSAHTHAKIENRGLVCVRGGGPLSEY